jgi:hypothetical protein
MVSILAIAFSQHVRAISLNRRREKSDWKGGVGKTTFGASIQHGESKAAFPSILSFGFA